MARLLLSRGGPRCFLGSPLLLLALLALAHKVGALNAVPTPVRAGKASLMAVGISHTGEFDQQPVPMVRQATATASTSTIRPSAQRKTLADPRVLNATVAGLVPETNRTVYSRIRHGIWHYNRYRRWVSGQNENLPFGSRLHSFVSSANFAEWAYFFVGMLFCLLLYRYLIDWPSTRTYHAVALCIWIPVAAAYNAVTWCSLGPHQGMMWMEGYIIELIFSMENVFLFHIVNQAFKTPRRQAQKAIFVVICIQIVFQFWMYIGLANWLRSIVPLPYILGVWLIYVGVQAARESDHSVGFEHTVEGIFKQLFGDRFSAEYREDGAVFFRDSEENLCVSLLGPTIVCLAMVDLVMEIDVTLTKIEEINNPYVAFSSSAVAAFAVPELYFVARDLFKRFQLLKFGISFILLFFGTQLLFNRLFEIPDFLSILIIFFVMLMCGFASKWFGYVPKPKRTPRSDNGMQSARSSDLESQSDAEVLSRRLESVEDEEPENTRHPSAPAESNLVDPNSGSGAVPTDENSRSAASLQSHKERSVETLAERLTAELDSRKPDAPSNHSTVQCENADGGDATTATLDQSEEVLSEITSTTATPAVCASEWDGY